MSSRIFELIGEDEDADEESGSAAETGGGPEVEFSVDVPESTEAESPPGLDESDDDDGSEDRVATPGLREDVDDLRADVDSIEGDLTEVRDSQESIAEQVEEMNDTVRRLAGMYDQVAAESNPFASDTGNGFDVVGDPSRGDRTDGGPASDASTDTVGYDDLAKSDDRLGGPADDDGHESPDASEADADHHGDGAATPVADPSPEPGRHETSAADLGSPGGGTDAPVLESLGEGYASTILAYEWLATMASVGGPACALRGLERYESMGWIGPDARRELESMLSGPGLDADVDPSDPQELSAPDHDRSFTYVRRLDALKRVDDSL